MIRALHLYNMIIFATIIAPPPPTHTDYASVVSKAANSRSLTRQLRGYVLVFLFYYRFSTHKMIDLQKTPHSLEMIPEMALD